MAFPGVLQLPVPGPVAVPVPGQVGVCHGEAKDRVRGGRQVGH